MTMTTSGVFLTNTLAHSELGAKQESPLLVFQALTTLCMEQTLSATVLKHQRATLPKMLALMTSSPHLVFKAISVMLIPTIQKQRKRSVQRGLSEELSVRLW